MNILFVHQAFPGQYLHLAPALAARGHHVVALAANECPSLPGVRAFRYAINRTSTPGVHPWAAGFEAKMIRGEAVARAAQELKARGFHPDVICAHPGWGEPLFLKEVWPQARLLCLWEFHYQPQGTDVGFDPEFADTGLDMAAEVHVKNASNLLALEQADWGVAPTAWQRDRFPAWARESISVIHEGIDTAMVAPDALASIQLASGQELRAGEEVVTFVSRQLEPYRGYHCFMRALPEILRRRPQAQVVIVGGAGVSYGRAAPAGRTWKQIFLDEVSRHVDPNRVHFTGQIPYPAFVRLMQISAVHVYLTYPFILSWSMLEAMSAGALVVGSRTPPVEEVLRDGENGLLVDFFDVQALAERVAGVLAEPAKYTHLRIRARADAVARYDLRTQCLPRQVALVEQVGRGELPRPG
jgi:glycosyltransferase involved in cell wall biosynthesis